MTLIRANIIRYWASGPTREPEPEGDGVWIHWGHPCFPDVATLTAEEMDLLRPVLAAHPEYLDEIVTDHQVH